MLKLLAVAAPILMFISSRSQQTVRLEIKTLPAYHASGSDIYLAGSFNGWNPQDKDYRFTKTTGGEYFIELRLKEGSYEYKITRGSWDKAETNKGGSTVGNRKLNVPADNHVHIDVAEWADRFPPRLAVSTASKNVRIIDTAFLIPQLKRVRRVWVYLPAGYEKSNTKYPVLYMHDGQNVFDDATSFSGEWGVDEFLDSTKMKQSIIVAVDHGGNKRINEYCPYDMEKFGKGEGDHYIEFLVKTLKPFIDKSYRTLKDAGHTMIAGSSMGGIISMYAILKYPEVFGGAGVFSPAFWVGPKIFEDLQKNAKSVKGRIYFYGGTAEGETMVPDMLKADELMRQLSPAKIETVTRDGGKHNEGRWRMEFPLFYQWVMK
jgi:predicted alpha/beta superfamily hydrolase